MFSNQFLSSYCFFITAVAVHRDILEEMKSDPDTKAVVEACKRATPEISKEEQIMLTKFKLLLLQLREEYPQDRKQRYHFASALGLEAAHKLSTLGHGNNALNARELMARAGIAQNVLDETFANIALSSSHTKREIFPLR